MNNTSQQPNRPPCRNWHGKPYFSLDAWCKNTYGEKLYKIAIDLGLTCPNRDGRLGRDGCIFCSAGGSGDFAIPVRQHGEPFGEAHSGISRLMDDACFDEAYQKGKTLFSCKKTGEKFIIYFQAYTNTYGPISYLERMYRLALEKPDSAGISIATRPDCLPESVMELLSKLKKEYPSKFIWIELGLQTIHEQTALFLRRGYSLSCFEDGVQRLQKAGIPVITHIILGLMGESKADMLSTIDYLNTQPVWGVKLQLLHILKGTDLGLLWQKDPASYGSFSTAGQYLDVLTASLERLRPDMVVHRVTGDAPKDLLLSPLWSSRKRLVLNTLHKRMKEQNTWQGKYYNENFAKNFYQT